ncbi:hypothetical protein BJX70DRAFT_397607 [Aspergillus crustosus]
MGGLAGPTQTIYQRTVQGPLNLTRAFLPYMRSRKTGTIIFISTVGSHFGAPGAGAYSGSKGLQEGLVPNLAIEIAVMTPGNILYRAPNQIPEYAQLGLIRAGCDATDGNQPGDPVKVARLIVDAVRGEGRSLVLGGNFLRRCRWGRMGLKLLKHGLSDTFARRPPTIPLPSFPRVVFKNLPPAGQQNLALDIDACDDDEKLRQLAESLDTGLLRQLRAVGGATPAVALPDRNGVDESIDNLVAQDRSAVNRSDQDRLRSHCLIRDGNGCLITRCWNEEWKGHLGDEDAGPLQVAHIVPFTLGAFDENDKDDRLRNAAIWFRKFRLILEGTGKANEYRIKTFKGSSSFYRRLLPANGLIVFTSDDGRYPLPSPILLAFHAAIGNILNLSARGQQIEKYTRDLGEMGGAALATDGNTNIAELLSVSQLSLWAPSIPHSGEETPKPPARRLRNELAGTENESPRPLE